MPCASKASCRAATIRRADLKTNTRRKTLVISEPIDDTTPVSMTDQEKFSWRHRYVASWIRHHEPMTSKQISIPCAVLRGGSSRAVYFLNDDVPENTRLRDRMLLAVVGGPDALQVDGIGGGHPLNNKAAIISTSSRDDADLDYLFLQLVPAEGKVRTDQNCGNVLVGVGPFAIETGLIEAAAPRTTIRVHMVNSGNICELTFETPEGQVKYEDDTAVNGASHGGASVICDFLDVAGSACGSLLPTGSVLDEIDGVSVTCIDNGMPVVILRAEDFDVAGDETPEELDANAALKQRLEALRLKLGPLMHLGDVVDMTVPKMCLVSAPRHGGLISTRTFIPHVCHRSVGILGAITVATACLLPGSVCRDIAVVPDGNEIAVSVEHPSGSLAIRLVVDESATAEERIKRAGVVRTARLIMRGQAYVPTSLAWRPEQAGSI